MLKSSSLPTRIEIVNIDEHNVTNMYEVMSNAGKDILYEIEKYYKMSQEIYVLLLSVILIIIAYMSMVTYARLHGRTFHEDLLPSMYSSDFPENDFDGGERYEERIRLMGDIVKNEHLIVGGLVYNMDNDKVIMLEKRLTYATKGWKSVTIHAYGLDSSDKHVSYLNDWKERDKRVVLINKMEGMTWKNKNVFVKMSNLRNRVHESLTGYSDDTFFLSMDYDLGGPISRDGILHARYLLEKDKNIGAVYANGIVSDSFINTIPGFKGWCFPGLGFCYYDDLALVINDNDESKLYKWFTATKGRGVKHMEVKSAYGGAGLMRMSIAKSTYYNQDNTVCEHIGFNRNILNKGYKVVVDPSFILLAGCQGHHLTRKVE